MTQEERIEELEQFIFDTRGLWIRSTHAKKGNKLLEKPNVMIEESDYTPPPHGIPWS